MFHNQKGFMMPLALIMTTLTILLCLHLIAMLRIEQTVLTNRYVGIKGDTLLRDGIKAVINNHPNPQETLTGVYKFGNDTIAFQEKPLNENDVMITLHTEQQMGATRQAVIHYDPKKGEIKSWIE